MKLVQWEPSKSTPNKFYIKGTNQFLDLFITLNSQEEEQTHKGVRRVCLELYEELYPLIDKTKSLIIEGYSMGGSILIELSRILSKNGYEGAYIATAPYPIYSGNVRVCGDLIILINNGDWVPKLFQKYNFPIDAQIEYTGTTLKWYQFVKKWNRHTKGYDKWK